MTAEIERFLASPALADSTRRAYRVDVEEFGRWLQAVSLSAAGNGERAEEAAVANGVAVMAMPNVSEAVEDRTAHDVMDSLAAYNGGPSRIARVVRQNPQLSEDELFESIPLSETRDYVRRVLLYSESYRELYP